MLSLDECMDFCGLDSDAVEGIADHEHLPLQTTEGVAALQAMLLDNIEIARCRGETARADEYAKIYRHFVSAHQELPTGDRAH